MDLARSLDPFFLADADSAALCSRIDRCSECTHTRSEKEREYLQERGEAVSSLLARPRETDSSLQRAATNGGKRFYSNMHSQWTTFGARERESLILCEKCVRLHAAGTQREREKGVLRE